MSAETGRHVTVPRRHELILVTIISFIVACAAIGGFVIGRHRAETFLEKVGRQETSDKDTLLSAGTKPLSLLHAIGRAKDNPDYLRGLQGLYGRQGEDQRSFLERLDKIVWAPPYQPAPFVGHMARPYAGENLHINSLGFRDERPDYIHKPPGTVRIFLTGGSTAWGQGVSTEQNTIARLLEQFLNDRRRPTTGHRYEVVNTAFPAWSTTQEKILIEQRLVDLSPDAIVMFSGNNDVHWSSIGRDIRWFFSYMDQNFVTVLNEMYKSSEHPEWAVSFPLAKSPVDCSELGKLTARNVEAAASTAARADARLIFALQPNIVSTAKSLTNREVALKSGQNERYWTSCYRAIRESVAAISPANYRFIDLSGWFGDFDASTELFADAYHFNDAGSKAIAEALLDQIDWTAIERRR